MRIRKHARISAPSSSPSSITPNTPPTQACELNRSPWDVIDFLHEYQVDLNDNDTCNSVSIEPLYAPESFTSLREQYWEDIAKKAKNEEVEEESDEEKRLSVLFVEEKANKKVKVKREMDYIHCTKTDGKGWFCKNEAKEGHPLCEHHLTQLKSYNYNYSNCPRKSVKPKGAVPKTATRPADGSKRKKRPRMPSSPTDFYYYSGFGPLWGRKRGGNELHMEESEAVNNIIEQSSSSSLVQVPDVHVHNDDDDGDDSDDDDENNMEYKGGKKRIRRPIKERSLKSLF